MPNAMPLSSSQEKVFKELLPYAAKIAHSKTHFQLNYDDVFSIAQEALHKAIYNYDPKRETKLTTYIYGIFNNDFNTYVSKLKREIHPEVSLDEPISPESGGETSYGEMVEDLNAIKAEDPIIYQQLLNKIKTELSSNMGNYWSDVFDAIVKQEIEGTYKSKTEMFRQLGKKLSKSPTFLQAWWWSKAFPMVEDILDEQYV